MAKYWDDGYDNYYTSYYTPSYTSKGSKGGWKSKYSGGGWSKSGWSSFTWSYGNDDDNNDDLYVKDPVTYLTPTASEIRKKVRAPKQTSIDTIKELARVCYFKMIDERDFVAEKFVDSEHSEHQQKKELYDSIFEQFIPGFTPLEQAVSIYLKMKGNKEFTEHEDDDDEDLDMKKGLDFDRQLYSDPNINEQLDLNELSKERKMEIMNHLSLVGQFGSEFKVEKEISEKIVANSDQYSTMIMRDYSQIHMMNLMQKVYPNFRTKFLNKDLTVSVPVDRKEQIQKIIILLDYSGSMDYDEKQIWVNAILIDRFKYVMRGEAEVFFSYFVHDAKDLEFHHIKNREDVIAFWQTFSNQPNGGCTDIGGIVEYVSNEVQEGKLHNLNVDLSEEKPEILIINDGQDSVGSDAFPYKVNAISLMEFSEELKDLCVSTGGKQIEITESLKVFSYSNEVGKQEVK